MPRPKPVTRFGCHTHFKILLEFPHPNPKTFSSNLNELVHWSWGELEGAGPPVPRGTVNDDSRMLLLAVSVPFPKQPSAAITFDRRDDSFCLGVCKLRGLLKLRLVLPTDSLLTFNCYLEYLL